MHKTTQFRQSPGLRLFADSYESVPMVRQQAGGGIPVVHLSVCTTVNNSRIDLTWLCRSMRRHKCSKISSFTRSVLSWFFWQSHNIPFIIKHTAKLVQTDTFLWLSSFVNWTQTKKLQEKRDLPGYYAACNYNTLRTLRDKLWVASSRGQESKSSLPLKMELIDCTELSVRKYHYTLRRSLEERSSHVLRGGSLKSRIGCRKTESSWHKSLAGQHLAKQRPLFM